MRLLSFSFPGLLSPLLHFSYYCAYCVVPGYLNSSFFLHSLLWNSTISLLLSNTFSCSHLHSPSISYTHILYRSFTTLCNSLFLSINQTHSNNFEVMSENSPVSPRVCCNILFLSHLFLSDWNLEHSTIKCLTVRVVVLSLYII